LIDIDPQANSTSGMGIDKNNLEKTIYEVLIDGIPIKDVILPSSIPFLEMVPSSLRLVGSEVELVNLEEREKKLNSALAPIREEYDFILIDTPPSLGLLTINTLTASDSVLIPIQCEYYGLEGLGQLLNTINLVQKSLNPRLQIEGVLLTMYDVRLNLSKQVAEEAKKFFGQKVYQTVVHRNVRISESPSFGKPIILYDISSTGAENYINLAKEILDHEKSSLR